jgi:hypothetical protein
MTKSFIDVSSIFAYFEYLSRKFNEQSQLTFQTYMANISTTSTDALFFAAGLTFKKPIMMSNG